jgi:hypothetical protein
MAVNNLNTPGVGIQPSLIDAKGDLLVGTANDAIDRLGVTGPTGSVLVTDAGETTGLKWVDPGTVGGLVHIETQSFSAVASQSFNDVFSATYDNYKVIIYSGNNSNTANVTFRFRALNADNSTSNYFLQRSIVNQTGTASAGADNGTTSFQLNSNISGAALFRHTIDILDPKSNSNASIYGSGFSDVSGYGTRFYGGVFNANTSFDGFSLINSSGNFSATVSIYGYRK